jgi:hypothetical protein
MLRLETPRAILITGPFGAGKSSLAGEIADLVEGSIPYAAIDLDWLGWFNAMDGSPDHEVGAVELKNLSDVVRNYLDAGVLFFVLARAVQNAQEADLLKSALPMPVTVIRLEVPLAELEARFGADITTDGQHSLRRTREWIQEGQGIGFEDLVIENVRPLPEVAAEVIERVSSAWA